MEVLCSKISPLGDKLWFVLDGSENMGRQRGEAVNVYFRLLGDVVKKIIYKAGFYWDGAGVL